mgnify:CR=1 FL=1
MLHMIQQMHTSLQVDVGRTLSETEYIGMCRREVLDSYLRDRAKVTSQSCATQL